jgi:hypothetical protein
MIGKEGQICDAFSKGRELYGNNVQAIIEIFPQAARLHFFFNVFVGSGNDPDIDFDGKLTPDTLETLIL